MARAGVSLDELAAIDAGIFRIRPGYLFASCIALFTGYVATALIWARIVVDLGGPRLSAAESVRIFMVGNLGRYVPGKVWQIAALAALARRRGVAAGTATAAAVLGQGTGLGAAMAIGLGAAWRFGEGESWRWLVPTLVLGGIALGLAPPVFRGVSSLWFRLARTEAPTDLSSRDGAVWVGLSLASWCIYAGAFWLLSTGLGFDLAPIGAATAFAAAYVLGYLVVFAPAGLGVREGFLIAFLSPGLGAGAATALAAAARVWTTVVEVVPAAAFWTRHLTTDGATPSGD